MIAWRARGLSAGPIVNCGEFPARLPFANRGLGKSTSPFQKTVQLPPPRALVGQRRRAITSPHAPSRASRAAAIMGSTKKTKAAAGGEKVKKGIKKASRKSVELPDDTSMESECACFFPRGVCYLPSLQRGTQRHALLRLRPIESVLYLDAARRAADALGRRN